MFLRFAKTGRSRTPTMTGHVPRVPARGKSGYHHVQNQLFTSQQVLVRPRYGVVVV